MVNLKMVKSLKVELANEEETKEILRTIDEENFIVHSIKEGTRSKNPYNPFTTSTIQQEASKNLGSQQKDHDGCTELI